MNVMRKKFATSIFLGMLAASLFQGAQAQQGLRNADILNSTPSAHSGAWSAIGPGPAAIEAAIAAHPRSRTIYIGSLGGGILKSTNSGTKFVATNNGLGSLSVSCLA